MTTATTFADSGERAIHLAVRYHVEQSGQRAPRETYALFDELNAAHFGGRLKQTSIWITATGCPRNYGDYSPKDPHGFDSLIRIAPFVSRKRGKLFANDVLLHEMVHGWCHEILNDGEPGYRGHGPKFADKCNELGKVLGLPAVFVRTRKNKDKPLCNHWPWCVRRPVGYYGPEEKVPETRIEPEPAPDSDLLLTTLFEAERAISTATASSKTINISDETARDEVTKVMLGLDNFRSHLVTVLEKVTPAGHMNDARAKAQRTTE